MTITISRRKFAAGGLASGAVTLGRPALAQGQPSGDVVLMAYSGIFQDLYTKAVVEPFQRKFPNIKIQYASHNTSASMLGQLRAQKADPQLDVVIMDAGVAYVANAEGLYANLTKAEVPAISELHPLAMVQEGFGPAVTFDHLVLIYDTTKVKETPTKLAELWNPQWKGKIGVSAVPNIQGIALTIMTGKMLGEDHTKSIDKAIAKIAELAPGVQTFDPQPDGYTMVLNEALVWATGWNARSQYFHTQSKGKLGVLLPEEGSVFQMSTINAVKGSKNPAAALVFINYALSAEAQKSFAETMYYAPVNKLSQVSSEVMARTAIAKLDRMIPVNWGEIAKVRDLWNNRWKREIIAK